MSTDWQQRYESGDMPWEKGTACPGLVDYLALNPLTGSVLVPGCGYGHDVRAIAAAGNRPQVIGIDLAPGAISGAAKFDNPPHAAFRQADFLQLPDEFEGAFDWLWEHTLFCAIEVQDRARYADAAARSVRPGGHFLGIFYLNPHHDEPGPPFGVTPDELDARFGGPFELVRQWLPARTYPGREARELLRLFRRR